jgi:putative exporter of polyketide antibiotics
LYLLILPLAFANSSVESLLIDTQREAFRGMSENETMMNLLGISDWDNVFTLEGMVTTYFMIPFVPILIGIATIILLNKLGSKAEEDGTFEFVAALPMTRFNSLPYAITGSCIFWFVCMLCMDEYYVYSNCNHGT